jgi:hypothetical protein
MVDGAADMKKAAEGPEAPAADGAPAAPPKPLFNAKQLMEAAAKAEKDHSQRVKPKGPGLFKMIYSVTLGPQPRFLVAAALVFGCALWVFENQGLKDALSNTAQKTADEGTASPLHLTEALKNTKPLHLPGMPEAVGLIFNSFNPAVAAILLIFSALWRTPWVSGFFGIAVVILLLGPQFGIPEIHEAPGVGDVSADTICLGIGLALAVMGVAADRLLRPDVPASRAW